MGTSPVTSIYAHLWEQKKAFPWQKTSTATGLVWETNMATVSLFWNNNVAAVTSCENALLQDSFRLQVPSRF